MTKNAKIKSFRCIWRIRVFMKPHWHFKTFITWIQGEELKTDQCSADFDAADKIEIEKCTSLKCTACEAGKFRAGTADKSELCKECLVNQYSSSECYTVINISSPSKNTMYDLFYDFIYCVIDYYAVTNTDRKAVHQLLMILAFLAWVSKNWRPASQ